MKKIPDPLIFCADRVDVITNLAVDTNAVIQRVHFKRIIVRYKKIGYNIDFVRQNACLVANPIKVNNFAYLFDCTTVGRASERMTVPS